MYARKRLKMREKRATDTTEKKNIIKVIRAKECKNNNVMIDLEVNGVTIYGAFYVEGNKDGKDYALVSFPSRKADNGKYYHYCYIKLSSSEIDDIAKQIDTLI